MNAIDRADIQRMFNQILEKPKPYELIDSKFIGWTKNMSLKKYRDLLPAEYNEMLELGYIGESKFISLEGKLVDLFECRPVCSFRYLYASDGKSCYMIDRLNEYQEYKITKITLKG